MTGDAALQFAKKCLVKETAAFLVISINAVVGRGVEFVDEKLVEFMCILLLIASEILENPDEQKNHMPRIIETYRC